MENNFSIVIFTDLDGSLLDRETFNFFEIKEYLKELISKNIINIPNSSKTRKEILNFNNELGENLPIISENGSEIFGLNNINSNFPDKIVLSREKKEILEIFNKNIPTKLKNKCQFISNLDENKQSEIFGLEREKIKFALNRSYTIPILFNENKKDKEELINYVNLAGLTLQQGGRVINLCDKVSKAEAMKIAVKNIKKINNNKVKTIGVGDNFNDLEMLKASDIPCLVFNDNFKLDKININNCLVSKNSSPTGWAEVVKLALDKIY